jgi:hypothetical protein
MGTRFLEFVFEAVSIFVFVMTPPVMIWGWIRWARRKKQWTILSVLSLAGFTIATASALLAASSSIYGRFIGGFPYYDPRLMRIYTTGALLSVLALILSLSGIWRLNSLRWHALFCSFGTLVYWIAMAETE